MAWVWRLDGIMLLWWVQELRLLRWFSGMLVLGKCTLDPESIMLRRASDSFSAPLNAPPFGRARCLARERRPLGKYALNGFVLFHVFHFAV
ncbi:hypothetical protein BDZ45DRAFT_474251 [Acephala macrosclerotiorum]|nr:hypothetical protein BDZ45DRAFT_474251 [Acephala macrosclerotiorum]